MALHQDIRNPASMGPRSVERGNNNLPDVGSSVAWLQWGRVRLNAETRRGWWEKSRKSSFNGAAFG